MQHYVVSLRHFYCSVCRVEFKTAAGLRAVRPFFPPPSSSTQHVHHCRPQHIELAAIHRGEAEDEDEREDEIEIDDSYEGWEDDAGAVLFPDENEDYYEPPVSMDDAVEPEDEYWDEDDEPAPEEEYYRAWAPVPEEYRTRLRRGADRVSIPAPCTLFVGRRLTIDVPPVASALAYR